jgi:DNA primase
MADFRAIKDRVSMLDVLPKYEISLRQINGFTFKGKCPLPSHTSESDAQTFTVNTRIQGWVCHSSSCVAARNTKRREGTGLKKGGDVIEFVQHMERLSSLKLAGDRLEEWFGPFGEAGVASPAAPKVDAFEVDEEAAVNTPLSFELKGIQHAHTYLTYRGFDEEECAYLGVGFFPGKGMMANRIVFPVHNAEGQLVGYAGRRVEYDLMSDDPAHIAPETESLDRWKFPAGFFRGSEIYNLHRVEDSEVILVESFFGVLACVRAGILNAVAIMSNNITDRQADVIQSRFKRVTVMLDGDLPGRQGVGQVVGKLVLADVEHVDIALLPKGLQPDQLTPDELRLLLRITDFPAAWQVVEDAATA